MKWKFWIKEETEKEKLKRMTPEEINEILTARQNAYQYKIDLENAEEAEKYFEDLYNSITTGQFLVEDQYKILKVICRYPPPKNVVIAQLTERLLFEKGYVITDVNKSRVWSFKLRIDVGNSGRRFFDDRYRTWTIKPLTNQNRL